MVQHGHFSVPGGALLLGEVFDRHLFWPRGALLRLLGLLLVGLVLHSSLHEGGWDLGMIPKDVWKIRFLSLERSTYRESGCFSKLVLEVLVENPCCFFLVSTTSGIEGWVKHSLEGF